MIACCNKCKKPKQLVGGYNYDKIKKCYINVYTLDCISLRDIEKSDEAIIMFKDPDGDDIYDVRYLYRFLYENGDYPYKDPKHPKYPYTGKEISNNDLLIIKKDGKSMIDKYPIDDDDDDDDDDEPNTQMIIDEGRRNHERNIHMMRLHNKTNINNTNTGDRSDTIDQEKMRADYMRRFIEQDIDLSDISD